MTFLQRMWAYITLGAMGYIWEEASPLIGGLAAYDRQLRLMPVVLAVALGTWAAGFALYLLGRWRGHWLRKRWPRFRKIILQSVAIVRRHPWRAALAVRFAYGLRLPLPIACGIGRVPFLTYTIGSGISSLAWSLAFTLLGWGLGSTAESVFGYDLTPAQIRAVVQRYEPAIGAVLLVLMIVGFIVVRRRHIADRVERVIDHPPGLPPAE